MIGVAGASGNINCQLGVIVVTEPTAPLVELSQCRTYIEANLGPAYLAVRIVHRIAKAPVSQLFTPFCVAHERRDYYPCVSHDAFHLTLQGLRLVRFTQ